MRPSFRLAGSLFFIVMLLGILFSYAMFQGGFTSWFLFYSFLPILLYPLGLAVYPIRKWDVTREVTPQFIDAGNQVRVVIHIRRKFPFPLFYCVCEEMLPETLNQVDCGWKKYHDLDQPEILQIKRNHKQLSFLWFRRTIKLTYIIKQVPRGKHQLKNIRIKTGDVFGLITKEYSFPLADPLIVYPGARPIHFIRQRSSHGQGVIPSSVATSSNTNVVSGVREYIPGDKFSWIDWKQTAKKNTLVTKEFEQEKSMDMRIVLDGCAYEGLNPLAFEASVEIAWSLTRETSKQGAHVEFLSIADRTLYFPVQYDSRVSRDILEHLTHIQPSEGRDFSEQLTEEMISLKHGMFIIVVTTNLNDAFKNVIQQMRLRGQHIHVVYIQSEREMAQKNQSTIQQLQQQGIKLSLFTERQLVNHPLEVNV